jgi:hypothetical protein
MFKSIFQFKRSKMSASRPLSAEAFAITEEPRTAILTRPIIWNDIPGWFQWSSAQHEAAQCFGDGSRFVEVGNYLGRSLCSLAEIAQGSGKKFQIIGVDTCRGNGVEGPRGKDYHGTAVTEGGGTFAGLLHRNILSCGFGETALIVTDSITASTFFPDRSIDWVHLDARHEYEPVKADIQAWSPKIKVGGWLSGDDYDEMKWAGVVRAVNELLPGAQRWSTGQWRCLCSDYLSFALNP